MHKSKNITKYNIHWQILRAQLKGNNNKLEEKLERAFSYFNANKTSDNWERCVNWLEGLIMGFRSSKNESALGRIQEEIIKYGIRDGLLKEANELSSTEEMSLYSYEDRRKLWIDLYNRNKKWLEKGYRQKEINEFMNSLCETFPKDDKFIATSFNSLQCLRTESSTIPNTHKFFF